MVRLNTACPATTRTHSIIGKYADHSMLMCKLVCNFNDSGLVVHISNQIKSNQINFIGIKSSHRTVTSHMYTVTQEQSQT